MPIKRKGMKRTKSGSGRPDMVGKGSVRSAILLRPLKIALGNDGTDAWGDSGNLRC
jgi:hypothetical protein